MKAGRSGNLKNLAKVGGEIGFFPPMWNEAADSDVIALQAKITQRCEVAAVREHRKAGQSLVTQPQPVIVTLPLIANHIEIDKMSGALSG